MASFDPKVSNSSGVSIFIDQQIRSTVPMRLTATGNGDPLTFSKSNPGPPACNIRLEISAISKSGSTNAEIRLSCPLASKSLINPRKSLAILRNIKQ